MDSITVTASSTTEELRRASGQILAELKHRASTQRASTAAAETGAPGSIAAKPAKAERSFGIRCVTTGKDLKRAFSDPQLAAQAAAKLTADMKRPYVVTGL